jgi:hypothetical protein
MIKNELELADKILKSDASEDAKALAAHYIEMPFALNDVLVSLEYITECTLATIESIACKNKPVYSEFRRQVNIAQKALCTLHGTAVGYEFEYKEGLRVKEVMKEFGGNVREWAVTAHKKYAPSPNEAKLRQHLYQ